LSTSLLAANRPPSTVYLSSATSRTTLRPLMPVALMMARLAFTPLSGWSARPHGAPLRVTGACSPYLISLALTPVRSPPAAVVGVAPATAGAVAWDEPDFFVPPVVPAGAT